MRGLSILLVGLSISSAFGLSNARGNQATERAADKPIATVLDKPIYVKGLELDESDKTALRDYFAIGGRIMPPLVAKYIKEHRLTATPQEIKDFRNWFSTLSQPDPADLDLTAEELKALDDSNRKSREPGTEESKALDEVAKASVESWKFNKALYGRYGGRVIFQQAGLEPLDAFRDWLRDEENAGSFQFHDPKWKDAFWEYYNPKYHRFVNEPDPFKVPLWKIATEAKDSPERRNEN